LLNPALEIADIATLVSMAKNHTLLLIENITTPLWDLKVPDGGKNKYFAGRPTG